MSKDHVVLSYDESLLRQSDLEILYGPHWLNDNIISFYFEYLKNMFKQAPYVLFVSPEVTQCIKMIPRSQIKVFLDPLDSDSKHYIFFALNDNERPHSPGGTHWSLLLFSRPDKTVRHYDSSRGSNRDQAENFARKLFDYCNVDGLFKEEDAVQQSNSYDCGIFLICNAEQLARYLIGRRNLDHYNSCSEEVIHNVATMRARIIEVINRLKE